jgi:hypothetical protein
MSKSYQHLSRDERAAIAIGLEQGLSRRRLIPLTQVHLYVVGVAHEAGRRFCEDCLA